MAEPLETRFIEAVNLHIGIIHKVSSIYFMGSVEREDVKQEMLYQLWKAYPGFQGNAKISTWMYRVCLNTALTYLKKSKKNRHEAIADHHLQISVDSDGQPDESIQLLYKAIENLTGINKAIILLYLEDLSYEEIAQITGLTKSNVSVRLVRTKRELEKELRKNTDKTEDAKLR